MYTKKTVAQLSCAIAAMLSCMAAQAASTNPTVTVVNTAANPVPVTGSISVANTVVPVEVSNAYPIPVKTEDGTPFYQSISGEGGSNSYALGTAALTIPAGKALLLSKVFVTVQLNGKGCGIQDVDVYFPYGSGNASFSLGATLLSASSDDVTHNYRSDYELPWKFLPGATFNISASSFGTATGCTTIAIAQLVGRLVNQ